MKVFFIGTILLLGLLTQVHAQYDVDHALSLLNDLEDEARQSLATLDQDWNNNANLLNENIGSWQLSDDTQRAECSSRQADLDGIHQRISDNQNYLSWLSAKIQEDSEKYNQLYVDRCNANKNYIKGLSNDKVTLGLIAFLRTAIENYEEGSFAQRKQIMKKIFSFIALYKSHNMKALLQMHNEIKKQDVDAKQFEVDVDESTRIRSQDDIGSGHIDENREEIRLDSFQSSETRSWVEYKAEILGILDELQEQITSKMSTAQEDEMNAGISSAEFRGKLEQELAELDQELYVQIKIKSQLQATAVEVQNGFDQCQIELTALDLSLESAQSEFEQQLALYQARREQLSEELEVFEYVRSVYQENVQSQGYQEKVDDINADGSLDGTYDERQVNQIDYISDDDSASLLQISQKKGAQAAKSKHQKSPASKHASRSAQLL